MDYREIDNLIAKFWAGETSLKEEEQLKDYFSTLEEVPLAYQDIAAYFGAMNSEMAALELDDDFEADILERIHLSEEKSKETKTSGRVFYLKYTGKIAAIVTISLASFQLYRSVNPGMIDPCKSEADPLACLDTFEDPEEAYQMMKEQLLQVSQLMNDGHGQVSRISKFHFFVDKKDEYDQDL
jgi:hypothetical protein